MSNRNAQLDNQFQKKALLDAIYEEMELSSLEDLQLIKHVINALNKSKENDFHFLGHSLGIEWVSENETIMHLGLHNENRYGNAQGGALYTLADVTIAQSIFAQLPEGMNISTLELKMNYFKPGQGKSIHAKGSILHWGRKTVGGECNILDESGQLIAKAMGTFYIAGKRV